MARKQFTFYESFYQAIKRIRKPEDRCLAYDALAQYALDGTMPNLDELPDAVAIVFELCKPNLDVAKKKSEGGKKSPTSKQEDADDAVASESQDSRKTDARDTQDTRKTDARHGEECDKEKEREKEKEKEVENESSPPTPSFLQTESSEDWSCAMASYQENIQPLPPGIVAQSIRGWCSELEPALVVRAIETAAGENVRSWKYIDAILQRCKKSGIATVAAFEASEAERQKRKEKMTNASGNRGEHQGAPQGSNEKRKNWGITYAVSG